MNYAVLIDLNSTRASCKSMVDALKKLDGNITYCKYYSYKPKRDSGVDGYIRPVRADAAVPLYNRKKARIDLRQVIDAVSISCTNSAVDAFFIVCAPVDCIPLLTYLKGSGKRVVLGGDGEPSYISGFDSFLKFERTAEDMTKQPTPHVQKPKPAKTRLTDEEVAKKLNMRRIDDIPQGEMHGDTRAKLSESKPAGEGESIRFAFEENDVNKDGSASAARSKQSGESSGESIDDLNVGFEELIKELKDTDVPEDIQAESKAGVEFLPYTGIHTASGDPMRAVKERLDEILRAKSAAKQKEEENKPTEEEMEKLLKKYF